MRQQRTAVVMAALALAVFGRQTRAQLADQPAAIITYPYVVVDDANGVDTTLQLSNTSEQAIDVRCVYENANAHCGGDGPVCRTSEECAAGATCLAGYDATEFRVRLTARQPIAWRASLGLLTLPCNSSQPCPGGLNVGQVPPAPEMPFAGSLLCFATDASGTPVQRNDLTGEATVERHAAEPVRLDTAKYNAVGWTAFAGSNDGDDTLVLGGDAAEYEGCPNIDIVEHRFDGAPEPVSGNRLVFTTLALLPCTRDPLVREAAGGGTLELLAFNEFEQRFGAVTDLRGQLVRRLSEINPLVFGFSTSGSLAGQTRIRSAETGLVALAIEEQVDPNDPSKSTSAAVNVHGQGLRANADYLGPKPAICGDGIVDAGEGCDDGNRDDGDCCAGSCQPEPSGASCRDDVNSCTRDECDAAGLCLHVSAGALGAECGCCQLLSSDQAPNGCAGDCDGDGTVSETELDACRKVARGVRNLCEQACDVDGMFGLEPAELAVIEDNHSHGCPATGSVCAAPMDRTSCESLLGGTLVPGSDCNRGRTSTDGFGCTVAGPTATQTPATTPTPPTATPTPVSLSLGADIAAGDTTIPVADINALPNTGLVLIDDELIRYSGKRPSAASGASGGGGSPVAGELLHAQRGVNDTIAAPHPSGANVLLIAELTTPSCTGDCNGDGRVRVEELVEGVNIALGSVFATACPAFDPNRDAAVKVDELVTGVNHALAGCTP